MVKKIDIKKCQCPSQAAKDYKLGTEKKGNDGNLWKVIGGERNGKKIKKWKKISKHVIINYKSKDKDKMGEKISQKMGQMTNSYLPYNRMGTESYLIHANGDRPFKVNILKEEIEILRSVVDVEKSSEDDYQYFYVKIYTIRGYRGFWKGIDNGYPQYTGNSLLIQLDLHNYLYIGTIIYQFRTKDIIYDYYSEVGNSDVPYPVAFGNQYVYFMLEAKYVAIKKFPFEIAPNILGSIYGYFYGHLYYEGDSVSRFGFKSKPKSKPEPSLYKTSPQFTIKKYVEYGPDGNFR